MSNNYNANIRTDSECQCQPMSRECPMTPTCSLFRQSAHQTAATNNASSAASSTFTSASAQAQSPHTPTNLASNDKKRQQPGGSASSDSVSSSSSNNSLIFTPPTVQQVSKQHNHNANHISNIPNQQTPSFPSGAVLHQKSTSPPPRPPRTPQFNNNNGKLASLPP